MQEDGGDIIFKVCADIIADYFLNPLSPNIHIQILQTDLHTFTYRMSYENFIKDQSIFPLVIILLILISYTLYYH